MGYCFVTLSGQAQQVIGLYVSVTDFEQNTLSYTEHFQIRVRSAWPDKHIKVKQQKAIHYLDKDSVYGYETKSGEVFRFQEGNAYQLLNKGESISLYRIQISNAGKYEAARFAFFFSKTSRDTIRPLSLRNLLSEFAGQTRFTELIELKFNTDEDLLDYDFVHQQWKLNRLLDLSQQKTVPH